MPIEISTEVLYVLIFFIIVVVIIVTFVFNIFDIENMKKNISNLYDAIIKFTKKIFNVGNVSEIKWK